MSETYQARLDACIDDILDLLDDAGSDGVELDPLTTIMERVKARGSEIDLESAPPMMRMLLGGMLG